MIFLKFYRNALKNSFFYRSPNIMISTKPNKNFLIKNFLFAMFAYVILSTLKA